MRWWWVLAVLLIRLGGAVLWRLRVYGVKNIPRELYVNALNFDNALAYRLS